MILKTLKLEFDRHGVESNMLLEMTFEDYEYPLGLKAKMDLGMLETLEATGHETWEIVASEFGHLLLLAKGYTDEKESGNGQQG